MSDFRLNNIDFTDRKNGEHPVHKVLILLRKAKQCNADPKIIERLWERYNYELNLTYWIMSQENFLEQMGISGLITDQSENKQN